MNDNFMKTLILFLVIIYIISPVDFVPGPLDDMLVLVLTIASRKGLPD